jgi:hypothetical protein
MPCYAPHSTTSFVGSVISGSVVDGAPTEEPRPDASNARSQRPATRAIGSIGVSRALACVLQHPRLPTHRCFTLPRSSILCGCINVPGRQVNAVWGRYPTACTMYVKKKLGVYWGLVDKISPAFELRNPGVSAVARSFQLACRLYSPDTTAVGIVRLQARRRNRTHPPPGQSPPAIERGHSRDRQASLCRGTAYTPPRLTLAHTRRIYILT